MSIKTYEIHNSYLQDAPDSTGITRMVSEEDYLSQLQQTDALQTSLNNIINAFGISGEGAHSKLVIEYVHGLVAENVAYKSADIMEFLRLVECMTGDYNDSNHGNAQEWIRHISKASSEFEDKHGDTPWGRMKGLATIDTDAAIAELRAQGVDALSLHMEFNGYSNEASGAREFAANLRAGRNG